MEKKHEIFAILNESMGDQLEKAIIFLFKK